MARIEVRRLRVLSQPANLDVRVRVHKVLVREPIPSSHFRFNGTEWVPQRLNTL